MSLHREEARLRRAFQRALGVALPLLAPLGCEAPAAPAVDEAPDEAPVEAAVEPVSATAHSGEATCTPKPFMPDPPDACGNYMHLACGLSAGVKVAANCYLWLSDCEKICPHPYFNCHVVGDACQDGGVNADAAGGVDIDCATCAKGVGRVPAGLARTRPRPAREALGVYFGAVAHLEAASVHAFRTLHRELAAHRAPARLLRAARRAERDEVRHARLTGRAARRFGGAPARPRVARAAVRPLEEVAVENAVEGCVRETFGALVASYQAATARDAEIARLMGVLARDETRHAALSWAVARWASRSLDDLGRARVEASARGALEALLCEADAPVDGALVERAGLPTGAAWRALADALARELWPARA